MATLSLTPDPTLEAHPRCHERSTAKRGFIADAMALLRACGGAVSTTTCLEKDSGKSPTVPELSILQ